MHAVVLTISAPLFSFVQCYTSQMLHQELVVIQNLCSLRALLLTCFETFLFFISTELESRPEAGLALVESVQHLVRCCVLHL